MYGINFTVGSLPRVGTRDKMEGTRDQVGSDKVRIVIERDGAVDC